MCINDDANYSLLKPIFAKLCAFTCLEHDMYANGSRQSLDKASYKRWWCQISYFVDIFSDLSTRIGIGKQRGNVFIRYSSITRLRKAGEVLRHRHLLYFGRKLSRILAPLNEENSLVIREMVVQDDAEVVVVCLNKVAQCRALPLLLGVPDIRWDTIIWPHHWQNSALWCKKSRLGEF